MERGSSKFDSCHSDQFCFVAQWPERRADNSETCGSIPLKAVSVVANEASAGSIPVFRSISASPMDSDSRLLSALSAVRLRSRRPIVAAGGRYDASYASHREFESLSRLHHASVAQLAEAANLKSATVLVRIQRDAPRASIPTGRGNRLKPDSVLVRIQGSAPIC